MKTLSTILLVLLLGTHLQGLLDLGVYFTILQGTGKFINLACASDSPHAIHLIKEEEITYHKHDSIITKIRDLLNRDWNVTLTHILREGNAAADYLAKNGVNSAGQHLQILEFPLPGMGPVLISNAMSAVHQRP
ncbi:Ribonuclease H-like superfamily [Sesbania bispinosa]|nr:Ribonuclease H-like superfamily [Sesbania bispinosa]